MTLPMRKLPAAKFSRCEQPHGFSTCEFSHIIILILFMRAMDGVEIIAKLAEEKCDSSNLFVSKTASNYRAAG
jgi:hypothetical protein